MKHRLALFEFRMIGDAVMALPFIRSVQEKYDVYVCCTPVGREVFRMVLPEEKILCWMPPWVDEVAKYSPIKLLRQLPLELIISIRKLGISVGVCGWADPRVSLLMLLSGIPRRVGFGLFAKNYYGSEHIQKLSGLSKAQLLSRLMECMGLPLLTEQLSRSDYLQHHLRDWEEAVRYLNAKWDEGQPWLTSSIECLPVDILEFISLQHSFHRPVGIVHCGARTEAKRWPVERFKEVITDVILARNLPLILIQLPGEEVPYITHDLVRLYRPTALSDTVALASATDYALCNDTGSAHLCGATGKPVVTIFSNSRPEWFVPIGNEKFVVAGADCPYKPCLERCVMPRFICRDGVPVEAVKKKLVACLSGLRC